MKKMKKWEGRIKHMFVGIYFFKIEIFEKKMEVYNTSVLKSKVYWV